MLRLSVGNGGASNVPVSIATSSVVSNAVLSQRHSAIHYVIIVEWGSANSSTV